MQFDTHSVFNVLKRINLFRMPLADYLIMWAVGDILLELWRVLIGILPLTYLACPHTVGIRLLTPCHTTPDLFPFIRLDFILGRKVFEAGCIRNHLQKPLTPILLIP